MKTLKEQILGLENQQAASQAVEEAVARAEQRRREMVDQVNANQRLEGYVPDEHLAQLQERFIKGELTPPKMIEMLTDYARKIRQQLELEKHLTPEQRRLFGAIDASVASSGLSGVTINPDKVAAWKQHVLDGMSAKELFQMIQNDKQKVIAVRPQPDYQDSPGMKHMGNGYFLAGDDPADPPSPRGPVSK